MQNKSFSFLTSLLLLGCTIIEGVNASQIPLGLDMHKQIFIQEYWLDDNPSYCVSNIGKVDRVVQVSRWQSRKLPSVLLDEWNLPAGSVRCHEAGNYQSEWLIEFKLKKGDRLGLLKAPKRVEGMSTSSKVLSYQSLNAACGTSEVRLEQEKLWAKSGEPFSMVFQTNLANGKFEFYKGNKKGQLPVLPVRIVASAGLAVAESDDSFVVNIGESNHGLQAHSINLLIDAPQVSKPTMMIISGRREISGSGWQCFIHGALLEP